MDLKTRLHTLREQAGAAAPGTRAGKPDGEKSPSSAGLQQRLARMRAAGAPVRQPGVGGADPAALAAELGAEQVAPGVLCIDQDQGLGEFHGAVALPDPGSRVRVPGLPDVSLGELAFVDTEASGLAGGTGTLAFNVGLVRWHDGRWCTRQYLLTGFAGEAAMLTALADDLREPGGLVTYNGSSFDLPLLRDRYRLNAWREAPLPGQHLDLLHPLRRLYRRQWPDCRLATAEARLLGLRRTDDLPGSQVPTVWFDWIHRGEGRRMADVLRHNRLDVRSLLALISLLAGVVREPESLGADPLGAARIWCRHGHEERALHILDAASELSGPGLLELARLWRRVGRIDDAVAIWERLASEGCPHSLEQLAKFHEHVRGDLRTALALTERLPAGDATERRRTRLRRRQKADQDGCGSTR